MKIEYAKKIIGAICSVQLHMDGIRDSSPEAREIALNTSLSSMLKANKIVEKDNTRRRKAQSNKKRVINVVMDELSIATFYSKINSRAVGTIPELVDICEAFDDKFEGSVNGHGIIIDGRENISLVKLDHDGDGALETLFHTDNYDALYEFASSTLKSE